MIIDKHIKDILNLEMYDREEASGTLSATTLIRSPREIVLLERHGAEGYLDDILKKVWSIMGSLVHLGLESVTDTPETPPIKEVMYMPKHLKADTKERRLKYPFMGEVISAKSDLTKEKKVGDYKVTGVYPLKKEPHGKVDWAWQLSINRWLYWKVNGELLEDIGNIYLFLRDWSQFWLDRSKTYYPPYPIGCLPISLMSIEETEVYITDKVKRVKEARLLKDDALGFCEDIWEGRKCKDYCTVKHWCNLAGQVK